MMVEKKKKRDEDGVDGNEEGKEDDNFFYEPAQSQFKGPHQNPPNSIIAVGMDEEFQATSRRKTSTNFKIKASERTSLKEL